MLSQRNRAMHRLRPDTGHNLRTRHSLAELIHTAGKPCRPSRLHIILSLACISRTPITSSMERDMIKSKHYWCADVVLPQRQLLQKLRHQQHLLLNLRRPLCQLTFEVMFTVQRQTSYFCLLDDIQYKTVTATVCLKTAPLSCLLIFFLNNCVKNRLILVILVYVFLKKFDTKKYKVTSSATNSCRTNLGSAKHCDNRVEEGNSLIPSSSAEPFWILQRK